MSTKINFDNISSDPINNVSTHIEKNIKEIIENFFNDEFEETRPNYKLINDYNNKIIECKNEIRKRKNDDLIIKREFNNLIIFFLFFFLIGFIFWNSYKKNETVINDFIEFYLDKNKEIQELTRMKNIAIFSSFSTVTLRDIYYYVFEKLGIQIAANIESKEIIKLINDDEILDVYCGVCGTFKNTPFYDVIIRKLRYEEVVWNSTKTFTCNIEEMNKNSNKTIDRNAIGNTQNVTASFTVLTPFIEKKNLLLFKTNFLKELVLSSNNINYQDDFLLENKDFIEAFKVINFSNNQEKLSQFFTIKAQDDFVKWYKKENGKVFNFVKKNNLFVVKNHTFFLSTLEEMNKTLDSLISVKDVENLNLEHIKNVLKEKAINYFIKFAKMIQLPLMIPGISREWYRESGKYLIGQSSDFEIQKIDNIKKIDLLDILNKFLDKKYFWFNSKYIPKKPIWITLDSSKKINSCNVAFVKINSFYEINLEETVTTTLSEHMGEQTVDVPYVKYVKFDEDKIILNYFRYKKTKTQYIVTDKINLLIFENHYLNNDLFKKVKKLSFWTNNPSEFENSLNKDKILNMAKQFNDINNKYKLEAALKIDEYGLYITINNTINVNEKILNELSKMLRIFSKINY